jgi:hypothetical protein
VKNRFHGSLKHKLTSDQRKKTLGRGRSRIPNYHALAPQLTSSVPPVSIEQTKASPLPPVYPRNITSTTFVQHPSSLIIQPAAQIDSNFGWLFVKRFGSNQACKEFRDHEQEPSKSFTNCHQHTAAGTLGPLRWENPLSVLNSLENNTNDNDSSDVRLPSIANIFSFIGSNL